MATKAGYSHLDIGSGKDKEALERVTGLVTANLIDLYHATSPQFRNLGRQWYPKVQEATEKGMRQHFRRLQHPLAGPGMVAAVSPNMEWEGVNIHAFHELAGLKSADWDVIRSSVERSKRIGAENKERKAEMEETGAFGPLPSSGRSLAASDLLKGMGISRAPDINLLKAHRIMEGENPEKVLNRQTAPKTFSFMHNIAGSPHVVTIDGRAFDMAVNQMRPWTENRGINSAYLPTGQATRYEVMQNAHKLAAQSVSAVDLHTGREVELQPHHLQAILWEYGRHLEMQGTTKAGKPRQQGPPRTGQTYLPNIPTLVPPRRGAGTTPPTTQESAPAQIVSVGRDRAARRGIR